MCMIMIYDYVMERIIRFAVILDNRISCCNIFSNGKLLRKSIVKYGKLFQQCTKKYRHKDFV